MMTRDGSFQRFLQWSLTKDMQLEIQPLVKFSGHLDQIQWSFPLPQSSNEPQLPRWAWVRQRQFQQRSLVRRAIIDHMQVGRVETRELLEIGRASCRER